MVEQTSIPKSKSESNISENRQELEALLEPVDTGVFNDTQARFDESNLSRNPSSSSNSSFQEDWDGEHFPPMEELTVLDILSNLALPQKLERWQHALAVQKQKVKQQQEKFRSTGLQAKEKVVDQWKKRIPSPEEQLEKYRKRTRESVDRLGAKWRDTATVTAREKTSFIAGVLNIFISGYLIGAYPQYFYYWFTGQLLYFLPIRYYNYHQKGYHYFVADLCYFVNLLVILSIWIFPRSKRLFLGTYCLAYGNNAVAIAMWRNSMVFHSLDKVTSLFIHLMPPVTLHCIVHMTSSDFLLKRFPAAYHIKYSNPGAPEHYSLGAMMLWSSAPYLVWQLSYHFLITVRRREKIAAGRPTSFTWLRKSYANTWIGKLVLSLPLSLQEPAYMLIQYLYAVLTVTPCPLWFWYRWASTLFLFIVFSWSIYNGATFYIDVFGRRFQNELEQLNKDVRTWQSSSSPDGTTTPESVDGKAQSFDGSAPAYSKSKAEGTDTIPVDEGRQGTTGAEASNAPRTTRRS